MITRDTVNATIQLILASHDKVEASRLERDLRVSKYIYSFQHLSDKSALLAAVNIHICERGAKAPTVLVVNHGFAGTDCETLLRMVRDATQHIAIQCVVTNPPSDTKTREKLVELGARLFEEEIGQPLSELSLH